MSINKNVLGLIFASIHDSAVIDLTKQRTMGSIPFGGRYRLIDFPLSNMVNSGIKEVGVITKSNYGSLLDHLGSGREWDLASKKGGLHLLPPFSQVGGGIYEGRLEALNNVWSFVEHDANKKNSQNKPSGIDAHIKQLHKQFSHPDAPSESGQSSAVSPEFHLP